MVNLLCTTHKRKTFIIFKLLKKLRPFPSQTFFSGQVSIAFYSGFLVARKHIT